MKFMNLHFIIEDFNTITVGIYLTRMQDKKNYNKIIFEMIMT